MAEYLTWPIRPRHSGQFVRGGAGEWQITNAYHKNVGSLLDFRHVEGVDGGAVGLELYT